MLFGKIKAGLIAIGVGIAAAIGLFLYVLGLGKKIQQAESDKIGVKENEDFRNRINAGHVAGDSVRGRSVPNDPNDRANWESSGK